MSMGNIGTIDARTVAELPQPLGHKGAVEMSPPRADTSPIGSLKWWNTSKTAKTIQGALASFIVWVGYEGHVFLEDWRATQKSVAVMNAELISIVKDNAADRKRLLEMGERQTNILDALSRAMSQVSENGIEIKNMLRANQ